MIPARASFSVASGNVGGDDRGVRRLAGRARRGSGSRARRSCSWIVSTPISLSSVSAGSVPTHENHAGEVSKRRAVSGEPQRRAELVRRAGRWRRTSPPGAASCARASALARGPGTPCRAGTSATCNTAQATASKRDASSGSQPIACVASITVSAPWCSRRRGDVVEAATSPVEDCTADTATTSVVASIASASRSSGTTSTRHAALLLGQEREQQRDELRLGGEHPRAVRDRGGDLRDQPGDRRRRPPRGRRRRPRASRTAPAPAR